MRYSKYRDKLGKRQYIKYRSNKVKDCNQLIIIYDIDNEKYN